MTARKKIIILIILAPIFFGSLLLELVISPFNEGLAPSNHIIYKDYIPRHSSSLSPVTVTLPEGIVSEPDSGLEIIPQEIKVMQGINNSIHWNNQDTIPISIRDDNNLFHFTINENGSHGRLFDVGEYYYHIESNPEVKGNIIVIPKPFEKLHRPTAAGDDHDQWDRYENPRLILEGKAFTTANGHMQDWHGFFQNIPLDKSISGIEVLMSASSSGISDAGINIELSWDGGTTYTSTENMHIWGFSDDRVQRFGGDDDTWGREWDTSELEDPNFRLRLEKIGNSWSTINVGDIAIQIHFEK